jgi:hypothetical protein
MVFEIATLVFEVQTGGSDSNGGGFDPGVSSPGTDYSQQASAQVAYTDLVIGAAPNQNTLTSAANPFGSTSPGNCINITGGTGFTTGLYRILSVSGSTATMDSAVGTAGSTGGTGNLGGAFATLSKATSHMSYGGQTTYIKGGPYLLTSGITDPYLSAGAGTISRIIGYTSTRGDGGQATLRANSGLTMYATTASYDTTLSWENITFDSNGHTGVALSLDSPANVRLQLLNCVFTNFTSSSYVVGSSSFSFLSIQGCEFTNTSIYDAVINYATGDGITIIDSYLGNNTGLGGGGSQSQIYINGAPANISRCIVYNGSGSTMSGITLRNVQAGNVQNNSVVNNAVTGILCDNGFSPNVSITNNIISGSATGINASYANTPSLLAINHNAYWNNTTDKTGFTAGTGEVSLTSSPFVSAGTNFALNSTAGGGLACQGAGIPGSIGISSVVGTGSLDIGALQHGASSGGAFTFVA